MITGILKHLLFWPVTGPMHLIRFSLDRVNRLVQEELTDDTRIKAELIELQLALELGDIDNATYLAQEAELLKQLRDVRQWREEFGMGMAGGVVRVDRSAATVGSAVPGEVVTEEDTGGAAAGGPERAPRVADPHSATIELHIDEE